jgi:hypothetical protein
MYNHGNDNIKKTMLKASILTNANHDVARNNEQSFLLDETDVSHCTSYYINLLNKNLELMDFHIRSLGTSSRSFDVYQCLLIFSLPSSSLLMISAVKHMHELESRLHNLFVFFSLLSEKQTKHRYDQIVG